MVVVAILWVLLSQFEGVFLGPYSRPEWGDGERLFTGYFPWLSHQGDVNFLAELMGGVDRYGFARIGGEIFSLRILMAQLFPFWVVIILFRILVPLVAFMGIYLFSKRLLRCPPHFAFALGALYSIGYDFTATLTFLYGFSLAGIPLLLYLLFSGKFTLRSWIYLLLFSILYIGTADPIYWLPAIWITVIIIMLWIEPCSKSFLFTSLITFSLFWIINYAEVIYAFMQFLPLSARQSTITNSNLEFSDNSWLFYWLMEPTFRYNHPGPLFAIPFIFSLSIGIWLRSKKVLFASISAGVLAFASVFLTWIPWAKIGISFLSTYRWYWEYVSLSIVLLATSVAGGVLQEIKTGQHLNRCATAVILALSLTMFSLLKIDNLLNTLTRGNLQYLTNIPNLLNPSWMQDHNSRVVTLPGLLDVNTSVNYGFSSYDGGATLVSKNLHDLWTSVMLIEPRVQTESLGFGLNSQFNQCCQPLEIDKIVNLDPLRLAGVRYIFTYRPLISSYLHQISGPNSIVEEKKHKKLIANPEPVFVYEIEGALPRVWWAKDFKKVMISNGWSSLTESLQNEALNSVAILQVESTFMGKLQSERDTLDLKIKNNIITVFTNGKSGTLIVNQEWLPWWHALTDTGQKLQVYPANSIHMAIAIPDDVKKLCLIYHRPLLLDLIKLQPKSLNTCSSSD